MSINLESIFEDNDVSLEELPIESLISSTSDNAAINFDKLFEDHLAVLIEQNEVKGVNLDESVLDLDVNNVEPLNDDTLFELDDCIDSYESLDYEYNANNDTEKSNDKPTKATVRRQSTRIQDQLRKNIAEQIQRENNRIEKQAQLLSKKKKDKQKTKSDVPVSNSVVEKSRVDHHSCDLDDVDSNFDITDIDDDDPNKLWCICQQPYGYRFMICCDICTNWYHGDCVGVSQAEGALMEESGEDFICPPCVAKQKTESQPISLSDGSISEDVPLVISEPDNEPKLQLKIVPLEIQLQHKSPVKLPLKRSNIFQILSNDTTVVIDDTKDDKKSEEKKILTDDDDECVMITGVSYEKPGPEKLKTNRTTPCLNLSCKELVNPKRSLYCSKYCIKKYSRIVIKANRKDKIAQYGLVKGLRLAKMTRFVAAQVEREFIQDEFESPTEDNLLKFLTKNPTFKVFQSVKNRTQTQHTAKPKNIPIKQQQPQQQLDSSQYVTKDNRGSGNNNASSMESNAAEELKNQACKRVKVVKQFALYIQNEYSNKHSRASYKPPDFRRIWDYCVQLEDCIFKQCSHSPLLSSNNNESTTTTVASSKTIVDNNQYESRIKEIRHILQSNPRILSNFLRGRISAHHLVSGVQVSMEDGKYRAALLIDEDDNGFNHFTGSSSTISDIRTSISSSNNINNCVSTTTTSTSSHQNISAGSASISLLLSGDNTHLHGQHLYDISCRICNKTDNQKKKVSEENSSDNSGKKPSEEQAQSPEQNDENKVSTSVRTPEMDMDISDPEEGEIESVKLKDKTKDITNTVKSILESNDDDDTEKKQQQTVSQQQLQQSLKNKLVPMWSGEVNYKEVGNVDCKAYLVSRLLLGATEEKQYKIRANDCQESLKDVINLSVNIEQQVVMSGRVKLEIVEDYLKKLRKHSNKEFLVFRLHPSNLDTGRQTYQKIFHELHSRNRCGVINTKKAGLKDCYVYPLNAHSKLPSYLLPFNGPGLERKRPHLLLMIVVRTPIHEMVLFKPISPKYDETHELDNKHGINFDNNIYTTTATTVTVTPNKTRNNTPTTYNTPDPYMPPDESTPDKPPPSSSVLVETSLLPITVTQSDVNLLTELEIIPQPDVSVAKDLEAIKPEDIPIPENISVENIPMPDFSPANELLVKQKEVKPKPSNKPEVKPSKPEQKLDLKSKKDKKVVEKKKSKESSEEKRKRSISKSPVSRKMNTKRKSRSKSYTRNSKRKSSRDRISHRRKRNRVKSNSSSVERRNKNKGLQDRRLSYRSCRRKISYSSSSSSSLSQTSSVDTSKTSCRLSSTAEAEVTETMVASRLGVTYFSPDLIVPPITKSEADIDLRSLNTDQLVTSHDIPEKDIVPVTNRNYTFFDPDSNERIELFYSPFVNTLTEDRYVPILFLPAELNTVVEPDQPVDVDLRSVPFQLQEQLQPPEPINQQFDIFPEIYQDTNNWEDDGYQDPFVVPGGSGGHFILDKHDEVGGNIFPEQISSDPHQTFPAHHNRYLYQPQNLLFDRFTVYSPPTTQPVLEFNSQNPQCTYLNYVDDDYR